METILFSIDDEKDLRGLKKFLRFADNLLAMGQLTGTITPCIGFYDGAVENSFIVLAVDYPKFEEFTRNQECIIRVPYDQRQPCMMEFKNAAVSLGPMRQVKSIEGLKSWTYVKATGQFFSTEVADEATD